MVDLSTKHYRVLCNIFEKPVRSNIKWTDIEKLFIALGAAIFEGDGSRVRVKLNDTRAVFHRPHPRKETDKRAIKNVRKFLLNANVKPD